MSPRSGAVQLVVVPYDSGHRGVRMGAGPHRLIDAGLGEALEGAGRTVAVHEVELPRDVFPAEAAAAFALASLVAERVRLARAAGALPIVLGGNCAVALGALAGIAAPSPAVVWLDAHGDFNTPDTSAGGFVDGMTLAIATGRCWRGPVSRIAGFAPVADAQVALVGARDLDPAESAALGMSGVRSVPVDAVAGGALPHALRELRGVDEGVYLHLDLDVLDPDAVAPANSFAAPGGLSREALLEAMDAVAGAGPLAAVALTAYDPGCDRDDAVAGAAIAAVLRLVAR